MTSFHAVDADYRAKAQVLRSRYQRPYIHVALHRRRCRHHDRNRTHRTITVDETLWDIALVAKGRHNATGGTVCVNLSDLLEQALRNWLISDGGVREEWLTGRLPDDWAEAVAVLERKREGRGKRPKRQKKPKTDYANIPVGFRRSEGDAVWYGALNAWCEARNLMLLDVKNCRPLVQLGPKGVPFFLDTQSRYSGFPQRSAFL